MSLYPLRHRIKDQWACIPYGIGLKTNGLASPMARDYRPMGLHPLWHRIKEDNGLASPLA
jgi:hypothetical protein